MKSLRKHPSSISLTSKLKWLTLLTNFRDVILHVHTVLLASLSMRKLFPLTSSGELWVKLGGGDKGRGSFKWNMQLVNIEHPTP